MEFPIGKKLFHLVVNPGTWPGARPWTWNWYKLQETSMEHDIPFGNSNRENGTTFLDFPLFLGIFQWDEPTKRVPFTAEPEIPEILTKWKAPCHFNCSVSSNVLCVTCSHARDCHAESPSAPSDRVQCFKKAKIDPVSPYPT